MRRNSSRRGVLGLSAGALTMGLAGCLGSVREYNPLASDLEIDDSPPIENRESATIVEKPRPEVREDGDVVVPANFDLAANVTAGGSVVIEEGADVDGTVDAEEHVLLEQDAEIDYDVRAGGRVVLRAGAEVGRPIEAGGDVLLRDETEIGGSIEADGDVALEGGAAVTGDVTGRTVDVAVTAGVRGAVHETE